MPTASPQDRGVVSAAVICTDPKGRLKIILLAEPHRRMRIRYDLA